MWPIWKLHLRQVWHHCLRQEIIQKDLENISSAPDFQVSWQSTLKHLSIYYHQYHQYLYVGNKHFNQQKTFHHQNHQNNQDWVPYQMAWVEMESQ